MDWPALLAWRMRRQQLAERAPRGDALAVVSRIAGLHAQVMASAEAALPPASTGSPTGSSPGRSGATDAREDVGDARDAAPARARRAARLRRRAVAPAPAPPPARLAARLRGDPRAGRRDARRDPAGARPQAAAPAPSSPPRSRARRRSPSWRRSSPTASARSSSPPRSPATSSSPRARARRSASPAPTEAVDGEEAARRVVRTYLAVYGPAPREQFQRWFGMRSPAEAGRWLKALGEEVAEVEQGWMLADDAEEAAAAEPAGAARLLPGVRPLRRRRAAQGGRRPRCGAPRGGLPPAGLALARPAGRRRHPGRLGAGRRTRSRSRRSAASPPRERAAAKEEAERLGAHGSPSRAHRHVETEGSPAPETHFTPAAVPPITTGAMSVPPPSSPPPSPPAAARAARRRPRGALLRHRELARPARPARGR